MRIEELSNSVRLCIAKPTFMSPDFSKKGCLPWIAVLIPTLFFTCCDVDINGMGFHGHRMLVVAALIAIATIFFRRPKRPLFIEISPFATSIYPESNGNRSQREKFDSYMIDQVSVTENPHPT